ncbi:hypothetical protein [Corynebacterium variabile]|uniref:hypothetical protein n=1 Tax=Corynebacterium variabile TaxID=1727 RepID=UPI003A942645
MTGHHWSRRSRNLGLTRGTRIAAVMNWRTATTPTGPMASKALAPRAAPVWFAAELVSISAMPVRRSASVGPVVGAAPAAPAARVVTVLVMSGTLGVLPGEVVNTTSGMT